MNVLHAALTKANIAPATVNQVVKQQTQSDLFVCYIGSILTMPNVTSVYVHRPVWRGSGVSLTDYVFNFPSNDPKYLPELVRAANNHSQLTVSVDSATMITALLVPVSYTDEEVQAFWNNARSS
jgi:hypothetical protein